MNTIKHRMTTTIAVAAFTLTFASACGTEVQPPRPDTGVEAPTEPKFHSSPDAIDRQTNPANCVFSPDAAESTGRPLCGS